MKHTLLALAFVLPIAFTAAHAATNNGQIEGTIADPTGALVPHAQITLTNTDGFAETLTTDDSGTFEADNLPVGSYSLSVNAAGFSPALAGDIPVQEHKTTKEAVQLRLAPVDQEIEVRADADSGAAN